MLDFVGWLRGHNDRSSRDERAKAGFYGLDLYSLYRSIHEVISYLDGVDPAAAARARQRYACFDHFSDDDAQVYGLAAAFGAGEPASMKWSISSSTCSGNFRARAADQFDAVIHIDETRAVEPLERTVGWDRGEVPETYPFAI